MHKVSARAGALIVAGVLVTACGRPDGDIKNFNAAQPNSNGATGTTGTAPSESGAAVPVDPAAPGASAVAPPASPSAATTPPAPASSATADVKPAAPAVREVTIPAGTALSVRLTTPVASDTSRAEQRVDGTLTRDVRINGVEALGAGATLRGIVTNAERSGRVKGRANVAFKFDHLAANGTVYPISTRTISREAPGTKKRDAATIGIPAAGGAIIGGIMGGGDAAVKGGVIGGAAGTAAVLSTRGQEVRLQPGTVVTVRLAAPLRVRVQ